MMPMMTGLLRIRGKDGGPDMVRVTDGDVLVMDVEEGFYRELRAYPPIAHLPWNAPQAAPPPQQREAAGIAA